MPARCRTCGVATENRNHCRTGRTADPFRCGRSATHPVRSSVAALSSLLQQVRLPSLSPSFVRKGAGFSPVRAKCVQSPYETLIQLNRSGEEKKMICIVILAGILTASAYTANAQDASGNPEAGRLYAREVCSPCHALTAEQASQRTIAIGPDFQTIANTSGITATALRAFLQTPHPKMPNLILTPEQSADVIAFVLSLRDRRQPESKPLTSYDSRRRG